MQKFSLCIFTVAVLLGTAAGNYRCIIHQLSVVSPDNFFDDPVSLCQDFETKFQEAREKLSTCTSYQIDTNSMESLYKEFCVPDSDFRQKFNRQKDCLFRPYLHILKSCFDSYDMAPTDDSLRTAEKICNRFAMNITGCLTEKTGKPCGQEGLEVYRSISKTTEPFFKGLCQDMMEENIAENENYYDYSGAAANTAFFCYILLGLLVTLKW